jgi:hypothetical protein
MFRKIKRWAFGIWLAIQGKQIIPTGKDWSEWKLSEDECGTKITF